MRPRPFKFFFLLSVGMILFFFVARIAIFALIAAAIMSTVFFVFRKIGRFFGGMTWDMPYEPPRRYLAGYGQQQFNSYEAEPVFYGLGHQPETILKERIIEVK